jgi:GntR family transcriptional regulator
MNRIAKPTLAPVDENLALPLYHQVYLVLRENIRNGVYGGGAIPTEAELCAAFGVSRITVKRAMHELTKEGLIVRQRGRGTFVAESSQLPRAKRDSLDDLLRNVMAIGAATEMQRLDGGLTPATPDVAAKLECEAGTMIFATHQIRRSRGQPIALIRAYVPRDVADKLPDRDTNAQPMLAQLQKAGVGVARADQAITASIADPATAAVLAIDVGAPIIRLTRLVFDENSRPVEWLTALYRADRYEYRTTLVRESLSGDGNRAEWRAAG